MKQNNIIIKISLLLLIYTNLNSCGIYRPVDAREFPPEPEKRVQKNLQEGKGFTIMGMTNNNKNGKFDFATSNEMWRASLDILDFMPLTSADYGGGLIITDWYSDQSNTNESIKISIRFLSNEIRADAVDVTIFEKICSMNNCKTNKVKSKLEKELKLAILKKATLFEKDAGKRYFDEKGKNRKGSKKDK